MILIDSTYINRSGGKVLLDDLIIKMERDNINVCYLFDDRVEDIYSFIPQYRKQFIKANIFSRFTFYLKYSKNYNLIFCFNGIPPVLNFGGCTWCYFHNVTLIDFTNMSLKNRGLSYFKYCYLKIFSFNIHRWLVQSVSVKLLLIKKLSIKEKKIVIAPFFRENGLMRKTRSIRTAFLYVSDAYAHKNHERLFEAFMKLSILNKNVTLYVTIDEHKHYYIDLLKKYNERGIIIINIGFKTGVDISEIYKLADCIIFPSTLESLGLGLIEAAQFGFPIIASDLAYVHNIIVPSYVFDPYSIESIYNAMNNFLKDKEHKKPELLIKSQLDNIVKEMVQYDI